MEKEFVPYELAVKLKELGFDEPCIGGYCTDRTFAKPDDELNSFRNRNRSGGEISAPLYQQAFRWFREKYNLFGCIDLHPSTPIHWYIRIDDVIENDYIYHSEDEGLKFGTYEMGELACLDKLIEIVEGIGSQK